MARKYAHNKMVVSMAVVLLCCTVMSSILLASLSGANAINIMVTASLLAVVLVGMIVYKHKIWISPELTIFVVWITFSLIPTLTAYHTEAALWKTFTLVQVALMVFAVQQTVVWSSRNKIFIQCFGVALVISYFLSYSSFTAYELAAMDIAGEHGSDVARIASTLADANMFGVTSCLALSLVFMSCAKLSGRIEASLTGLLVAILIVGIIHSGSRTALIGLVIVLLGAIYTYKLYKPSRLIGLGSIGLVVAGLVAVAMLFLAQLDTFQDKFESLFIDNDRVLSRLEEFVTVLTGGSALDSADGSISGRTQLMLDGLAIAKENPFFGAGLANFSYVSGANTYAHSTPIELLVSTGFIGAAIYYMIYAILFYRLYKLAKFSSVRNIMQSAAFGLLAYVLMDVTHVSYNEKTSWIFLAIVSATVEVQRRELLKQKSKSKNKKRRRKKPIGRSAGIGRLAVGATRIVCCLPDNTALTRTTVIKKEKA